MDAHASWLSPSSTLVHRAQIMRRWFSRHAEDGNFFKIRVVLLGDQHNGNAKAYRLLLPSEVLSDGSIALTAAILGSASAAIPSLVDSKHR